MDAVLIDWGTTNFRAWLVDARGQVLERLSAPMGIRQVPGGDFAAALDGLIGPWRARTPRPAAILSGMIGSRQGWLEAPYVACPAGLADLVAAVTAVPGVPDAVIVPGLSFAGDGRHDVLRGEETQIFGSLGGLAEGTGLMCLPGTHSKWAETRSGRLSEFRTSMTGEVFAALSDHTILGALMSAERRDDAAGFAAGLQRARKDGGLLHHLFSVRTEGLFATVPETGLRSYLSGLLIGHEIIEMHRLYPDAGTIQVIGEAGLAALYGRAFAHFGLAHRLVDSERASVAGLLAIRDVLARET